MKSIDQRIHEFRGKCWHEFIPKQDEILDEYTRCRKCEVMLKYAPDNLSYTTQIEPYWELLQEVGEKGMIGLYKNGKRITTPDASLG